MFSVTGILWSSHACEFSLPGARASLDLIWSSICRKLILYELVILDDLSAGQGPPHLPRGITLSHGDFTDSAITAVALRGVNAVVHLAALPGVIDFIERPGPSFEINVAGTFQLLDLARRAKVDRFINASTGAALLGEVAPPISESMAPGPLSPYGASKLAAEGYCSAFAGAYGLPCVTLRFSNIYGPRSGHKKSVIAAFIKNVIRRKPLIVFGDGTQKRDYLYVGDLVQGIGLALRRDLTGAYLLGSATRHRSSNCSPLYERSPTVILRFVRISAQRRGAHNLVRYFQGGPRTEISCADQS